VVNKLTVLLSAPNRRSAGLLEMTTLLTVPVPPLRT
jgi:hypothetical protein